MRLSDCTLLTRKTAIYRWHLLYNGHRPDIVEAMEAKINEIESQLK